MTQTYLPRGDPKFLVFDGVLFAIFEFHSLEVSAYDLWRSALWITCRVGTLKNII